MRCDTNPLQQTEPGRALVSRHKVWKAIGQSLCVVVTLLSTTGCGYSTRGLYPDNFRTVSVPIFKSQGLRRDLEFLLTQKLVQSIEAKTPYKVVASDRADTEIRGTISAFYKGPYGEDQFDNPNGGVENIVVSVTWVDRRSGEVLKDETYRLDQTVSLNVVQPYNVDLAQTQATAINRAADQICDYIIALMHSPW